MMIASYYVTEKIAFETDIFDYVFFIYMGIFNDMTIMTGYIVVY